MALVRSTVLQLRRLPHDPRNWRPNILLFAGDVRRRAPLVRLASWLVHDRGILTVADLRVGNLEELAPEVPALERDLDEALEEMGIVAFGEVDIVEDFVRGAVAVAQANGIAGIESNTVMFGWSDKPERRAKVLRVIEQLAALGISSVICHPQPLDLTGRRRRRIDVWWGGLQNNGDMLVLFAHLISLNPEWRDARISIKSIATSPMMLERNRVLLDRLIRAARIRADTDVMLRPDDVSVTSLICAESQTADIVLMGLRTVAPGEEDAYARRLAEFVDDLPTVLFVRSAGEFRGKLLGADGSRRGVDGYDSDRFG